MKKIMVKLVSIFVVLSMLCTTLCITSFASSVSYDGEILIDGGNPIYSQNARKDYLGTYTLTDGSNRQVPVYRLVRQKDEDFEIITDSLNNTSGMPNKNNDIYCITAKVWAPAAGNYNLETMSNIYDSRVGYNPYTIFVNGVEYASATYDADAAFGIGDGGSYFAIHNWGTVTLAEGNNTVVLKPANRTNGNTYSMGLGYMKFIPSQNKNFTIDATKVDAVTDMQLTTYGTTKTSSWVYDAEGNAILKQAYTGTESSGSFITYTFTAPASGYYDLTVHSNGMSNKAFSPHDIYVDDNCVFQVTDDSDVPEQTYQQEKSTSDNTLKASYRIVEWDCGNRIWLNAGQHTLKFKVYYRTDNTKFNFLFYKADFIYEGTATEVYYDDATAESVGGLNRYANANNGSAHITTLEDGTELNPGVWRLLKANTAWTIDTNLSVSYTLNVPKAGRYKLDVYSNGYKEDLSDYTLKLNGSQLLKVDSNLAVGEPIAADTTDKKLIKFTFEVDLNKGENILCLDNIQPVDGYDAEGNTPEKYHRVYFWKASCEQIPDVSDIETRSSYYRVTNNVYGAYSDLDENTYSNYDAFVTGSIYTNVDIQENMNLNMYLAEYDKTTSKLNKIKVVNIPVAKNTDTLKTSIINYDITADDFDMTVDSSNGAVTFNNIVKLFVWNGVLPVFESETIAE